MARKFHKTSATIYLAWIDFNDRCVVSDLVDDDVTIVMVIRRT